MSREKTSLSLKELLVVSRPFWWVNTAAGFVASYFIINSRHDLTLYVGVLYFAFAYNLMMYGVNDIYDYDSDIKNPRKIAAGIEGSVMNKAKHPALWWWIVVANIPPTVYLLWQGSLQANLWLIFMIFMVFAYSQKGLRFKEIPFVDSATSAFHYTSPFIYGGLLAGGDRLYWPAFVVYFIWVMANHAFGAIQDITPDRQAGISSVATVLGASRTIVFVLGLYILAALLPMVFYGWRALAVSVLLGPYIYIVARTLPRRHDDTSPLFRRSWKQFLYVNYVVGFLLTIGLLIASDVLWPYFGN